MADPQKPTTQEEKTPPAQKPTKAKFGSVASQFSVIGGGSRKVEPETPPASTQEAEVKAPVKPEVTPTASQPAEAKTVTPESQPEVKTVEPQNAPTEKTASQSEVTTPTAQPQKAEPKEKKKKVERVKKGVYLLPKTARWLDIQAVTENKEISELAEEALQILIKLREGKVKITEA